MIHKSFLLLCIGFASVLLVLYHAYLGGSDSLVARIRIHRYNYPRQDQDIQKISKKKGDYVIPETSGSLNIVKIGKEVHDFTKGVLKFDNRSVDMYLHGKHDMISQSILRYGMWEGYWIDQLITYLKAHPGIQLIDAGCNLGVYTLVAATLGHKVIAIDANKNNTDRLAQSVLVNNLTDRVTIVLNALSDERKTFSMNRLGDNIGGQMVLDIQNDTYQVKSIFLDDLLPLLDPKQDVMMKMDIQAHEVRAMKAASKLFERRNIKLILIEWVDLKNLPDSYTLMGFLLSRNYSAHKDFYSKEELAISNYQAWAYDVVWRRI